MGHGLTEKPFRRILVCITEDWFAVSHFKPLLRALRLMADEVVVATSDTGRAAEFAALGVTHRRFDYARRSTRPGDLARAVRRLRLLIDDVRPDAVHLVAVQTIVLGCLAVVRRPHVALALHVTGLGALGGEATWRQRLAGFGGLASIGALTLRHRRHLFIENPEDRALFVRRARWPAEAITQLGGAGIDPVHFAALAEPALVRIGFSGRLVRQKGVHVLVEAMRLLRSRGLDTPLDLFAKLDPVTREAYTSDEIATWQRDGLATWHGHVDDIRTAWQAASIAVAPSVTREGLPRAILEAAACARALVVTDVPGSRHFVRDGLDGLIVPPNEALALADALERLVRDPGRRLAMAASARQRVLEGFTEAHVEAAIIEAYKALVRQR